MKKKLEEGIDYYIDENTKLVVFTALYLTNRGYCCGNECKHCPYTKPPKRGNEILEIKND